MTDYVFLDFDGVCHSWGRGKPPFEPACLEALAEALQGTQVVIASSWREERPLEELRPLLGPVGPRVVGMTPVLEDPTLKHARHEEVLAWLRANASGGPWSWIALDDEPAHYGPGAKLYACDRRTGFTAADIAPFRRLLARREVLFKHSGSSARDLEIRYWLDREARQVACEVDGFDSALLQDFVTGWLRGEGLSFADLVRDDSTRQWPTWRLSVAVAGVRYGMAVVRLLGGGYTVVLTPAAIEESMNG